MFELIFASIIGLLFITVGWQIWKKEKIGLIHAYQYNLVAQEHKRAYTAEMGKGIILLGTGLILAGATNFATRTPYGLLALLPSFGWGFTKIFKAQMNYNGGLF